MSQFFQIHPDNPQLRLIKQAVQIISQGGIVAIPTDSCYALVCHLDDKDAVARLRCIRGVDEKHHLTLLCRDLSEIALYAKVDNSQYRMLKAVTPGPFTMILEATKEVPRRLSHPSRKTIGLRVPENPITRALLDELKQPLLATTLILPDHDEPLTDPLEIREQLEKLVELVIDGGYCTTLPTTVIDMSDGEPVLVRQGRGNASQLGL
jgi:tRNA threonylcarbamoyl adenosine modification protein (Sua5/YciO/YrdC/YwlC family)